MLCYVDLAYVSLRFSGLIENPIYCMKNKMFCFLQVKSLKVFFFSLNSFLVQSFSVIFSSHDQDSGPVKAPWC